MDLNKLQVACLLIFLLSSLAIAYVIAGYPLLLKWLATRYGRGAAKQYQDRTVSILIAVYNGEKFLADKLKSVVRVNYPRELMEVFVISDGSTDGSSDVARRFADQGVVLIDAPRGGKPAALNLGLQRAKGEILVLTDVRQVLEPDSIREIVACFSDPTIGVVSGDLPMMKGLDSEEANTSLYWRYEREIRKNLGRLGSTFGATGPFYAMRRELAPIMPTDTILDDMYLPLAAYFKGYRVIVDEQARALEYPFSMKSEFRRKMRTLAGNYQIMWKYPALLTFRNPMLFHFISYKIGRLALPWIFLALFLSSLGLPQPWAMLLAGGQVLFYLLAVLDIWIPEGFVFKRISTPARTVVTMLAAAATAVAVFFVPPHRLWKVTQARHRG